MRGRTYLVIALTGLLTACDDSVSTKPQAQQQPDAGTSVHDSEPDADSQHVTESDPERLEANDQSQTEAESELADQAAVADGFPSGQSTPEGVACVFARAFIKNDWALLDSVTLDPFGAGEGRERYAAFLESVKQDFVQHAEQDAPVGPKKIVRVYEAQHLSMNGPASRAYALYDFHDLQFVDVVAEVHGGGQFINRTLV